MSNEPSLANSLHGLMRQLPQLMNPLASPHSGTFLAKHGLVDEAGQRTKKGAIVLQHLEAVADVLDVPIL
jgi:hypothetical protein